MKRFRLFITGLENSNELKKKLESSGNIFKSQTDTEVITVILTEKLKKLNPLDAVFETLELLKGKFCFGYNFQRSQ